MATSQKISELTTAGPLTGTELVPIVQNSGTVQTTINDFVALANISISPVVSALQTQIDQVSAAAAANTTAITSVQADVSALTIRVASVSAVTSVNAAAITSIDNVVSALEVRVSSVSAAVVSANSVIAGVSALVSTNTAAITSVNAVVSTLEVRVSAVSATGVINTDSITSINAVISALDTRVAIVSAALSAVVSVAADVSAKVNRVGDYMDSVQYIEFDTSTSYAASVGRLTWDIEYGTLDIGLAGGNSNVLIGQREVMYIYNNTSATLPKGKVVEVTGAQGQRLTVKLAQADSDANSATVLGIMLETVSVNNSGYVATNGIVRNVNTGAFTDGQIVYLSPTSAGELTATKPVAPQHLVMIGYIVKGGSVGAGSIYVKTQNGYEIGELHDVKTSSSTSISNNEVLAYNSSAGVWTNSTVVLEAQASVSALNVQVAAVSALVSALDVRVAAVSASVSALQVQVNNVSAALTSANTVIAAVSARTSVAFVSISVLQVQVNTVSTALTSTNNVVSALEIRVSSASATGATNTAAITSINNVVSALDIRVVAVSASVSALQVQVNAVSVSVGQRVLKAGDTMTGNLNISTSADAQAVSVAGYATFTSRVSISAGFYTGLQNYQDVVLQRATFKDYALAVVAKGSVSATTSLDLLDGNFFTAIAAGSTTFVFANPPVSVSGATGLAAGGFILELANGGAATVTWPAAVKWPGGTAPTLTSSGTDVFVFITDDGGTVWRGVQSMKDSK